MVISQAELAVWLDLPLRVSLGRMSRRTVQRVRSGEMALRPGHIRWVPHEIHSHIRRRLTMGRRLAAHPSLRVVHLRSQKQVDAWLATQPSSQLGTFVNAGAGEGSNHRSRSAMTSQGSVHGPR